MDISVEPRDRKKVEQSLEKFNNIYYSLAPQKNVKKPKKTFFENFFLHIFLSGKLIRTYFYARHLHCKNLLLTLSCLVVLNLGCQVDKKGRQATTCPCCRPELPTDN